METINPEELVYCSTCDRMYKRKEMISWYSTDTREEHICPRCAEEEAVYVDEVSEDE